MAKTTATIFSCSHCDAQFQKWIGRCLTCGKWGTVEEQLANSSEPRGVEQAATLPSAQTMKLSEAIETKQVKRISTKVGELDRVLGGGIVPGSMILLGGEPGIGKSTLAIQMATLVPEVLYVSGEESVGQVSMRAKRLGLSSPTLRLANEIRIETICSTMKKERPPVVIIDSIQTVYSVDATGEPGNPTQVKACAVKLLEVAKSLNIAVIIIGHVTKDGNVAGPRTLEHLVDTVLYLEGDRHHAYRILRTVKNRFGSTDEVGVFEMDDMGLKEVTNPSASFLEERDSSLPGSVVTCLMEGTRPILVEVQALVNKTSFGYPQRKASGFDLNRLHVLIAVLQKRAGVDLMQYDVHVNVVGGIQADEPAADLAVSIAIASAFKDTVLGGDLVVFGEVGLGGEIRSVRHVEKRLKECEHLGMKRVITKGQEGNKPHKQLQVISVKNIAELVKRT
ncbi:MAG: DNA repair protein RadA [Candidatus Magasanikbacteria bacterium]|nr:DNA repair protein RadA [Candidatus Magasanikbacteria bacterium]NCS71862.1 DNA repair protein RadA [Candidatus Magasanikbacteria bacterium]